MDFIVWIVFGALVGWVASMVLETGGGLVWDILVGMVGAVLGGFIMSLFNQSGVGGFNFYSFVVALIGACVLICVVKRIRA